jgi:hypothetical protein
MQHDARQNVDRTHDAYRAASALDKDVRRRTPELARPARQSVNRTRDAYRAASAFDRRVRRRAASSRSDRGSR